MVFCQNISLHLNKLGLGLRLWLFLVLANFVLEPFQFVLWDMH